MDANENHFDRLHDDLLCLILNRVHDAKSLCACLAVSTRFNSLALHSTNLSLTVDRIHFNDGDSDDEEEEEESDSSKQYNLLRSLFRLFVSRPIRFLTRLASNSSRTDGDDDSSSSAVFYSPSQALKSFSRIEILKIQLPSHGELQLDRACNPLLRWKATFGTELKTCVIVAATSVDDEKEVRRRCSEFDFETCRNNNNKENQHRAGGLDDTERADAPPPPPFSISNEDLKMRVVWTISSLIAASSRHHLLKRIVAEHPMLKAIEMVDEHRQGTLTMDEADISQLRTSCSTVISDTNEESSGTTAERSRIPALKMKMWHAAELELPGCKKVMRGATLVVIGAAGGAGVGHQVEGMFEEEEEEEMMMYGEAAIEIRKKMKQSYSLEMESF